MYQEPQSPPRPLQDLRSNCLLDCELAQVGELHLQFKGAREKKKKSQLVEVRRVPAVTCCAFFGLHRLRHELPQTLQRPGGVRVQEEHQSVQHHRQSDAEHYTRCHEQLRGWVYKIQPKDAATPTCNTDVNLCDAGFRLWGCLFL